MRLTGRDKCQSPLGAKHLLGAGDERFKREHARVPGIQPFLIGG